MYHDGTNSVINITAGFLKFRVGGTDRFEVSGAGIYSPSKIDSGGNINVYGHVKPWTGENGTFDLGTNTLRWRNAYVNIVSAGSSIAVGTGVTIETNGQATFTGIVTASTYYGDGSNLSNITSTTINSNTNNYLITGTGTANTLQGEANLTFDGSTLTADGDVLFKSTTSGREVLWDKSIDRMIFRTNARASFGNSSQLSLSLIHI